MARGKKRQVSTKQEDLTPLAKPAETGLEKPSILEYAVHFVIFVAFCLVSALLVWLVTGYTLGLSFFFGVLILGFFVVCVFSYIHDRLYRDEDEVDTGPA